MGRGKGRDLRGEFDRLGAEALLPPFNILPERVLEGRKQESQHIRYPGGRCEATPYTSHL